MLGHYTNVLRGTPVLSSTPVVCIKVNVLPLVHVQNNFLTQILCGIIPLRDSQFYPHPHPLPQLIKIKQKETEQIENSNLALFLQITID